MPLNPDFSVLRSRDRTPRPGRALVELIVATLLLAVASSAALSLLRVTGAVGERVTQHLAARTVLRDVAEAAVLQPCAIAAGSRTSQRIIASWSATAAPPAAALQLNVTLLAHPMAATAPRSLHAVLAGWCV